MKKYFQDSIQPIQIAGTLKPVTRGLRKDDSFVEKSINQKLNFRFSIKFKIYLD